MMKSVTQNEVFELSFQSVLDYQDPYNDVDLDVLVVTPDGRELRIPTFWTGDQVWKARLAGDLPGEYMFRTEVAVDGDSDLRGQAGTFSVKAYDGDNVLLSHGRLRVGDNRQHFEHEDGTPFFWIGDTWWMGLTTRLDWPNGFKELASDRVAKGYNVIQIIAGPYPDMDADDSRGCNEAGFPFSDDFVRINPYYYNHADLKIAHIVEAGMMPCIVGMWGYYLVRIGIDRVKRFWRYLIARYGAYPVVWCMSGEATMPYYLYQTPDEYSVKQKKGWTQVMAYVRDVDPYENLITIHPTQFGRAQVENSSLMNFEMLQSGHLDMMSVQRTIDFVTDSINAEPAIPVINAEVNYEGILGHAWQNIQRLCFYHSVLRGTAGHTYGANGIWQMSTEETPYGASPHGRSWGNTPWREAAMLPGSRQIGIGGQFMRRFPWWQLQRRQEWIRGELRTSHPEGIVAVGIPRQLRIIYIPMCWDPPLITSIEADVSYKAYYFDPCTGEETDLGLVSPSEVGEWEAPFPPECHDWLLVMVRSVQEN